MKGATCLLLCLAWTPTLGAVPSGLSSLDAATLGPGADVAGRAYEVGHFELKFGEGSLYPVRVDGEVVGGMFIGRATLTYRSTDPLEETTFRTNLKRATKYSPDAPMVRETVSKAILWDPLRVSGLAGDGGFPEGETPEKASSQLADVREEFDRLEWTAVSHIAYQIWQESPSEPAALGLLVGARHHLVYEYDTIRDGQERLSLMRNPNFGTTHLVSARYRDTLSVQAIGRNRLERAPRRFMLEDVDLVFVSPSREKAELDIHEVVTTHLPLRTLALDLWSQRITDVARPYHVRSVERGDGTPLAFSHRANEILVELPERVPAGTKLDLRFVIEGEVLRESSVDDYWRLVGRWLPTPGRPDCAAFTYHAVVKVTPPRIAFSNGTTVRRWQDDEAGLNCVEYRLNQPISYVTIVAGEYYTFASEREGIRVEVSSYRVNRKERLKRLANNGHALLALYQRLLGPYPFHELKIIEIDDYGWGQAPPGVIFLTREAFEPVLQSRGWSDGVNRRLSHEIAHTWWGQVAKWSTWDDQWLSESMAEYYSAFTMGEIIDPSEFREAQAAWKRGVKLAKDHASLYLSNQIAGDDAYSDRYYLLYAKGPLMLHGLRQEIGDDNFFTLLKSFMSTFRMKHVETRELVNMTSWLMKEDYSPWFQRYLFGVELPELDAKKGNRKKTSN